MNKTTKEPFNFKVSDGVSVQAFTTTTAVFGKRGGPRAMTPLPPVTFAPARHPDTAFDLAFDDALWRRIEAMRIDPLGATTTFIDRLREYNSWTADFASKVDREYRRFLYLAARAGHPVTPSGIIDQAWHLHLIYTHHYWDELCGNILGKPLHHVPSSGSSAADAVFDHQYVMTLESYRRVFGEEPPKEIWPMVATSTSRVGGLFALAVVAAIATTALVKASGAFKVFVVIVCIIFAVAIVSSFSAKAQRRQAMTKNGKQGACGAAGSGGHYAAAGGCGSAGDGAGDGGGGCGGD